MEKQNFITDRGIIAFICHEENKKIMLSGRYLFLLLILIQQSLSAQVLTQTIRGKVTDSNTEVPVIGATIIVVNSSPLIGAATDVDGNFRLNAVPLGRHTLKINLIGYEELILPDVVVGSGKEIVLNLRVTESLVKL
jgi:hypothetical protein